MAKQTFTAGQVLTATQMNNLQANDYNWSTNAQTASYVLVAADAGKTVTMTNAAATTITVNTSLFSAGDTIRIINLGAGATTITAGTATVNSASSLALAQYQSGTLWFSSASAAVFSPDDRTVGQGLTYITGATFSAASTVIADGCFTSTYRNYVIYVDADFTTGVDTLRFYLRTSGTDNTSALYYNGLLVGNASSAASATYNATQTSGGAGYVADLKSGTTMTLYAPQVAIETAYSSTFFANGAAQAWYGTQGGFYNATTQFDGIKFFPTSSTITGQYRIYGLANS